MDSGNSGSLQSSSGGDEEYDSRAAARESVSGFMSGGGTLTNPSPPLFDPFTSYLQPHQNTHPSLLDPNPAWTRFASLRSGPSNSTAHDSVNMLPRSSTLMPQPILPPSASRAPEAASPAAPQLQNPNQTAARNPKKRSRASRRAPTTVLTTDTSNFRAMVQEFTGIPAPPFDGGSSFPQTRHDLFRPSRSPISFDPSPAAAYLRSPFAQKIHHPPLSFLPSAAGASCSNPSINNYQIPAAQTSENIFQNLFLPSLLQTDPKFPFPDHSPTQFTLGSGHGPSLMPSRQPSPHNNSDKDKEGGINGEHCLNLMTFNGGHDFPDSTENSKMNNFLDGGGREKRPENNNSPGEGMVDSWICSSE